MKILMCYPQSYSMSFEETGRFIEESFNRKGVFTNVFDDLWRADFKGKEFANQQLLKMYKQAKPDVLFMLKSEHISPETLKQIDCPKILWHPDVRKNVQSWVVDKAKECDLFYTMSKGSLPEYNEAIGSKARYLPEACDPNYHFYKPNVDSYFKSDVNFIGAVRQNRIDMCKRVIRDGHNFKMWGGLGKMLPWDKTLLSQFHMNKYLYKEFHSYAASGSINVTWDWCPEVELSYSARIYRVMASRGLYLAKYVNGMEKVFKRGVHLDWYETLDEMSDKLKYYTENPKKKEVIGLAAQKEVYDKHTFDNRIDVMLKDIKKEMGGFD